MVFNFARGHPNRSLLPVKEMQVLMADLASTSRSSPLVNCLGYGDEQGDKELLLELSSFVERHTKDDDIGSPQDTENGGDKSGIYFPKNELFITNGVSHGIDLLCATQSTPGDVVMMERPSYFLVSGIFQSHGLVIQGLPMHERGVDVDRLIRLVESSLMDPPRMIYIVPTHQNPTARTMRIQDRRKLAAFAARNGILVVADEVYHLLDWRNVQVDGPRPARMACLNPILGSALQTTTHSKLLSAASDQSKGCCVTVSSFTKIFSPGIRCGWIEGPPSIIESLKKHGYIASQGGCAPFVGIIICDALASGAADKVLHRLTVSYRYRAELLCSILETDKRIHIVQRPLGGFFLWIRFPPSVSSEDFLRFCKDKVRFLSGIRCDPLNKNDREKELNSISPLSFKSYARLCFADLDLDELGKGANQFVLCFKEYLQQESLAL